MKFSNVLVETSENIYEEICEVLRRFKIIIELCVRFHSQLCFSFSIYSQLLRKLWLWVRECKANEKIYLI